MDAEMLAVMKILAMQADNMSRMLSMIHDLQKQNEYIRLRQDADYKSLSVGLKPFIHREIADYIVTARLTETYNPN